MTFLILSRDARLLLKFKAFTQTEYVTARRKNLRVRTLTAY